MFVQKHMLQFQVLNDLFLENWSKINVIKWQVSKYKLIPNDDTKSDGPGVRTGFTGERGRGGGGLLSTNTEEELIQLKLKIVLSFSSHLNNNYSKVVLRRFSLGRLEGTWEEKDKHLSLR